MAVAASILLTRDGVSLLAQQDCEPRPAGFRLLRSSDPWETPWAFRGANPQATALPVLSHSLPKGRTGSITVRLDDGTRGTVHIDARDCGPNDDCSPYDCGCTGLTESYWIEIRRPGGSVVARKHLWAAYGRFEIVPVDLVDGPGDELLIARIPAHASPPIGWDLQIWQVSGRTAEIGSMRSMTTSLGSLPWGCGRWIALLTVDPRAAKPRPIRITADFGATACCRVIESAQRLADLKRPHALQFDAATGRYVLSGPAPKAFTRD